MFNNLPLKSFLKIVLPFLILPACSHGNKVDPLEKLEQPPQIISAPLTETPNIDDENLITNGLGDKVQLQGGDDTPILTISLEFDNAWLLLAQALIHNHITVTDRDREAGHYLVNFDTDTYKPDQSGFLQSLNHSLFSESFGFRKYQLSVKDNGKQTLISAMDLGAITKAKDDENKEEIVDSNIPGPSDSQRRILATLFKTLHDGFSEFDKPQR